MKHILSIIAIAFSITLAYSQDNELKIEDVKVIKDFDVQIADFNKINIDPVLPTYDIKSRTYTYSVRPLPVKLDYEKPQIRPLALKPEILEKSNNYYLKAGYGIPNFLELEASAGFKKNDFSGFAIASYLGADNSKNIPNQKISQAKLDFDLKKNDYAKDISYGINGGFTNNYNYFYSNVPIIEPSR
ncbi:MAG: hypothetical protein R2771_05280 [Saprospiraceae bacterium]